MSKKTPKDLFKESSWTRYREAFMDMLFPLDLSCHICKEPLQREPLQLESAKRNMQSDAAERNLRQSDTGLLKYPRETRCEDYLCPLCIDEISWIEGASCKKCSIPLYESSFDKPLYEEEILRPLPRPEHLCPECREDSPLDRNLSACLYEKPIKAGIHAFKYSDKTYLARVFALMMAKKLRSLPKEEQNFDLILSVPLHKKRLRHRGYNQADLLGKYLSKELEIPYDSKGLSRIRETQTMNRLSRSQRGPNVNGAFLLQNPGVKTKRILLIDDIYTTGATAKSIAALLKEHGAAHITMLSVARVVL